MVARHGSPPQGGPPEGGDPELLNSWSNLGNQVRPDGVGLWLFQRHQNQLDFMALAIVVQVAKILTLALVGPHLQR